MHDHDDGGVGRGRRLWPARRRAGRRSRRSRRWGTRHRGPRRQQSGERNADIEPGENKQRRPPIPGDLRRLKPVQRPRRELQHFFLTCADHAAALGDIITIYDNAQSVPIGARGRCAAHALACDEGVPLQPAGVVVVRRLNPPRALRQRVVIEGMRATWRLRPPGTTSPR